VRLISVAVTHTRRHLRLSHIAGKKGPSKVLLLTAHQIWLQYHTSSLHPPGNSITAAVFRTLIKATHYTFPSQWVFYQ